MKTKALLLALALLLTAYALAFAQEDEPPRPGIVILPSVDVLASK